MTKRFEDCARSLRGSGPPAVPSVMRRVPVFDCGSLVCAAAKCDTVGSAGGAGGDCKKCLRWGSFQASPGMEGLEPPADGDALVAVDSQKPFGMLRRPMAAAPPLKRARARHVPPAALRQATSRSHA